MRLFIGGAQAVCNAQGKGGTVRQCCVTASAVFQYCMGNKTRFAGRGGTQAGMAEQQMYEGALQEAPPVKAKRRRRCTTCGAPTTNYRCENCWRRLRGFSCEDMAQGVDPTLAYSGRLKRVRVALVPEPWKPLGAMAASQVPDRQSEFFAARTARKEEAV